MATYAKNSRSIGHLRETKRKELPLDSRGSYTAIFQFLVLCNMWRLILTFFCVKIYFAHCDIDKDSVYKTWTEDLFGTGLTEDIITKESKRHIASSTEDLKILFNDEQLILQTLLPKSQETELYLKGM